MKVIESDSPGFDIVCVRKCHMHKLAPNVCMIGHAALGATISSQVVK